MVEEGSNGSLGTGNAPNIIGEMTRPALMSSVPELVDFVSSVERQEGFTGERIEEVGAALREALANIAERADAGQGKDIVVTCKHDHWRKLVIVIADRGRAFNILLADVVFQGEEGPADEKSRASARLIKKMIDNIEQKRVDETNVLTFSVSPGLRTRH